MKDIHDTPPHSQKLTKSEISRKRRKEKEERGIKQLNFEAPIAHRETLREIGAQCIKGRPIGQVLFLQYLKIDLPTMPENKQKMLWEIVEACKCNDRLDKALYELFWRTTTHEIRARHELRVKLEKNRHLFDLGAQIHRLPNWQKRLVNYLVNRAKKKGTVTGGVKK